MSFNRRRFLVSSTQLPIALWVTGASAQCIDEEEMSDSVRGMRESLEYTDVASNPQQVCGGCSFFHAGGAKGCGNCEVLSGPVNIKGHCVSWTKRA